MGSNSRGPSRSTTPRAMDLGDPRIPSAWSYRDGKGYPPGSHLGGTRYRRSTSPAITSSTPTDTSSDEEEMRLPGRRYQRLQHSPPHPHPHPHSHPHPHPHLHPQARHHPGSPYSMHGTLPPRSGTLRSSRSMPGLALTPLWDPPGSAPCPVHGGGPMPHFHPARPPMRKAGSMMDLRVASPAPSFYGSLRPLPPPHAGMYATLPALPPPPVDMRSHYGSLRSIKSTKTIKSILIPPPAAPMAIPIPMPPFLPLPHPNYLPPMPPPYLLPPGARPRPLVVPAEPLPVRDPNKPKTPSLPPTKEDNGKQRYACCRGPMPFVWFVVVLVSVGVILGIILGATLH